MPRGCVRLAALAARWDTANLRQMTSLCCVGREDHPRATTLDDAGERPYTFTRPDPSQWKSARTTNAIERLNETIRRRIKTQTVLPCAETMPMLLWALLASGQIEMRKVEGNRRPHLSRSHQRPLVLPPERPDLGYRNMGRRPIETVMKFVSQEG